MNVPTACDFLGISRAAGYDAIARATFPVRTIKVGRSIRVVTASLLAVLEDGTA